VPGAALLRQHTRAVISFPYAPRTGGAYDSHHRTAGIAGRTRRCGRLAACSTRAAAGDAVVGFLRTTLTDVPHYVTAFRQGLKEAGFVESQNVAVEYRSAEGRLDRLPELAAELVRRRVAVVPAIHVFAASTQQDVGARDKAVTTAQC